MKRVVQIGALGTALTTASVLTLGMGIASADSISNTGPSSYNAIFGSHSSSSYVRNTNMVNVSNQNYQTARSGNATVIGNTVSHPYYVPSSYGGHMYSDWNNWNPTIWQQGAHSFNDWWSGMMGHMGSYDNGNWGYGSWMPSGSYWQSDWNNWNPTIWQQHGSSYNNWYSQCMQYLHNKYGYWQQYWPMSHMMQYVHPSYGSATTGNATNNNSTNTNVNIENTTPSISHSSYAPSSPYSYAPAHSSYGSYNKVSNTGPHSYNAIHDMTQNSTVVTNTNNVSVNNTNMQTATSGDATVSDNTFGGSATTGNATNNNSTNVSVDIANN